MTEKNSDPLCDPGKSLKFFESQFLELMCITSGHKVITQQTIGTIRLLFSDQVTSEAEKKLRQDNELVINEGIYSFSIQLLRIQVNMCELLSQ